MTRQKKRKKSVWQNRKLKCPICKKIGLEINYYECPFCGGGETYQCSECYAEFDIETRKEL